MHLSPGEFAEEVSICLCCGCEYKVEHLSCYWKVPKLRQPIGIHVSPGEITEEVSVCLCSGCEYEVQGCGNSGLWGLPFIVVLLKTALEIAYRTKISIDCCERIKTLMAGMVER